MAIATRRREGPGRAAEDLAVRTSSPRAAVGLEGWRALLRADMAWETCDPRWPRALAAVGVVHLVASLVCQAMDQPVPRSDPRYLAVWFAELVAVLATLRMLAGPRWASRSAAVTVVVKLWTTLLILSFNVVTLNSLTGFETPWFRAAWCTLGTFFFATLAWLFTPLFFIPAVGMWAAGMLAVTFSPWFYVIHGVSWLLILLGVAANLRRGR